MSAYWVSAELLRYASGTFKSEASTRNLNENCQNNIGSLLVRRVDKITSISVSCNQLSWSVVMTTDEQIHAGDYKNIHGSKGRRLLWGRGQKVEG